MGLGRVGLGKVEHVCWAGRHSNPSLCACMEEGYPRWLAGQRSATGATPPAPERTYINSPPDLNCRCRSTCSDTATFTQWDDSAHPREFGTGDAVPHTVGMLQQGYAAAGECTSSGLAAAAQAAALQVLRQALHGGDGVQQAAVEPPLGARCPLFARKFVQSAVGAWTALLQPVVNPR